MNSIKIYDVEVSDYKIICRFIVQGEWKKFFKQDEFWIEYSESIWSTPKSIAVIPFLCNILPIAWISDAEIYVDEIDKEFYDSINEFKRGYIQMYPKVAFKGKMEVKEIVNNLYVPSESAAAFFSGGVDAFSTLVSHATEEMTLITVWGADVFFDDITGWYNVKEHVNKVAQDFGMKPLFVKSSFRLFLNEEALDSVVFKAAKDYWWHGFQHGIGLIGHAAPCAFNYKMKHVYIGSTFTVQDQGITCASDPTIDNYVRLSSCKVIHDGYQYTRQDKIHNICRYKETHKKTIQLRVCWQSKGGKNCCSCEKCYRTIYAIIAENCSPYEFGFHYNQALLRDVEWQLKNRIELNNILIPLWKDVQKRFCDNRKDILEFEDIKWIYSVNFEEINTTPLKKIKKYNKKIVNLIRRIM